MKEQKTRIAVIDYDKCQPEKCNYLCIRVCPINKMDKECIVKSELTQKPLISEDLCTGCGICVQKCPFHAIHVINLSVSLKEPIHQFSQNSFRLYRLPFPRKGEVLGLVGKNGVGKTTALKILSGKLIPNLGDYAEPASFDKVIDFFKGKEIQSFFKNLKSEGITVSFKPQNIEELPRIAKGKVKELLKKVDERKKFSEAVHFFNLENSLERSLSELSGGELQRVAIAAAWLKDAEIYSFDEPSSFLDVSERLKMAKALRALTAEGKGVLVIEHDLAVLDYLSDFTHIFFGTPAVYGVVSSPKTVRAGINEFLEGFISDENLRFRDHAIKFAVRPPVEESKRSVVIEYGALEKTFPSFSLSTDAGHLRKGEVVGILGPNAIGKTTFVKMLAGLEPATKGEVDKTLKIAFKPQHIAAQKNFTVEELLNKAGIDRELFKLEVDRRLNVSDLMEKNAADLSGGELQKVAVSLALCMNDADIFLLDEPSAFVDAEDRLKVAEAIKGVADTTGKPALVVDHDILFQDYVSERLIVFEGEPGKKGHALAPKSMHEGMNLFLKNLGITFRRDESSGRPRANKQDSVKDTEQKQKGEYYYTV
ncbi:MAG: ribosome biogenesis/translation initiation ATPase RLI [Candidatus Diapherotrites archaeon]